MTKGPIKNMPASVHQRLTNISKQTQRPFNEVLQHYALERWLFRLSQSKHREHLVLKGALLHIVWKTPARRLTRDIDLLGRLNNNLDSVRTVIADVCQTQVDDDGLVFDSGSVATQLIAEDADYEGVRATFNAKLGMARIAMQVDIGFSDVITPAPTRVSYPSLLEQPTGELFAYNRETAIAEKFEAMVKLAELNSRMKDFFDISVLAANFEFDAAALAAAIKATFDRRGTQIDPDPICFTDRFATDQSKTAQWKAFARRGLFTDQSVGFPDVVHNVREFLLPIAIRVSAGEDRPSHWPLGGPWRE